MLANWIFLITMMRLMVKLMSMWFIESKQRKPESCLIMEHHEIEV